MRVVDCQGLAGGPALGAVQAGFELHAVKSVAGFGTPNLEANRHLLPGGWEVELSETGEWTPERRVPFVFGCPPCAGFSLLNTSKKGKARGPDSEINACMRMFGAYAAVVTGSDGRMGPEVAAFESVQQAGKIGLPLMREIWQKLREDTGQPYELTHVFMSGASVGAAQVRKRYFWVAHRVPFGIESPIMDRVATYEDAIGDLMDLKLQWADQPTNPKKADTKYWWLLRNSIWRPDRYVDAHVTGMSPHIKRVLTLVDWWPVDHDWKTAYLNMRAEGHPQPEEWRGQDMERLLFNPFGHGPVKINPVKCGRVITGEGGFGMLHWAEPRILTVRECSRLMGFPDTWDWSAAKGATLAYKWLGKQVPVQSTQWLSRWVRAAIEGRPGKWFGRKVAEDEWEIDITHDYKAVYDDRKGVRQDSRTAAMVKERVARPA